VNEAGRVVHNKQACFKMTPFSTWIVVSERSLGWKRHDRCRIPVDYNPLTNPHSCLYSGVRFEQ